MKLHVTWESRSTQYFPYILSRCSISWHLASTAWPSEVPEDGMDTTGDGAEPSVPVPPASVTPSADAMDPVVDLRKAPGAASAAEQPANAPPALVHTGIPPELRGNATPLTHGDHQTALLQEAEEGSDVCCICGDFEESPEGDVVEPCGGHRCWNACHISCLAERPAPGPPLVCPYCEDAGFEPCDSGDVSLGRIL